MLILNKKLPTPSHYQYVHVKLMFVYMLSHMSDLAHELVTPYNGTVRDWKLRDTVNENVKLRFVHTLSTCHISSDVDYELQIYCDCSTILMVLGTLRKQLQLYRTHTLQARLLH